MSRVNVMEARKAFSKTIDRVAFDAERIVLERRGEDVAALISMKDLRLFEKLLVELEDRLDAEDLEKAVTEPGEVPYAEVRRDLGLK